MLAEELDGSNLAHFPLLIAVPDNMAFCPDKSHKFRHKDFRYLWC